MTVSSLISKLNNKHFLSLAGNAIMSVMGVITMALLYHFLPVAETGAWVFFTSIILLIEIFRSGFLTTAFIKFYAGAKQERADEVIGSTWYLAIIITGSLLVLNIPLYFLFHNTPNTGLNMFFTWFGITYVCSLPFFIANCVLQGEQRFDRLLYLRFVNQALFIVLICILTLTHHLNLTLVLFSFLISSLTSSLFALFSGWIHARKISKRTRACTLELYHFGKYSVGTNISSSLLGNSDTIIITAMLGEKSLAIYNLGRRLMEIIEIPLRSFNSTAMPSLSVAYNRGNKDEVVYILKKYTGMLTVALIPVVIGAFIFADVAISLIGGGKYVGTPAANVLRIFMSFSLLYPADRFMALTLDVIHKPRINFIKVLIMLAANIITDFAGIYLVGNVYGVAAPSIFSAFIGIGISYWALQKYQPFAFRGIYLLGYNELKFLVKDTLVKLKLSRAT